MIITGSGISMNATSTATQRTTYETLATNLSNSSLVSASKTEIVSFQLQMSSNRQVYGQGQNKNTVDYKNPAYKKKTDDSVKSGGGNEKRGASAEISEDARNMANKGSVGNAQAVKSVRGFPIGYHTNFRYNLLDSIVQLLSGGKSNLHKFNSVLSKYEEKYQKLKEMFEETRNLNQIKLQPIEFKPVKIPAQEIQLNFQRLDTTTTFHEQQSMNFQASGSVKTADGREINLEVNLSMSSEFYSSNQTSITEVMKDPLVINVGPNPVMLTQNKFDFDIDCDGTADQISFATGGSGFLVFDANGDGTINDGSELFGARTGDGFAELSAHDGDGNGWIDEADDIFNKLRIWTKDEEGNDKLVSLGEAGIGALYLGNVDTDFNLRGNDGSLDGQIRKTGIYLNENGTAGTMHHVDVAV